MHLVQAQSLASGQIINKPYLYEKYFPLPFQDKYIVFAPHSKDSKNYDYWQDVLSIINPILNKAGIKILQIGAANERPFNHCIHLMGHTNVNQVAFLIKHSLGVVSTDTFAHHIADAHNIKSTILCSNNYSHNVRGYFHPENQTVLEPSREANELPSFALQEQPKSINRIPCEKIAQAICSMLNLDYDYSYQTIYIGEIYFATMLESACDCVVDPRQIGAPSIIMRMDYNFNEQILANHMQICEVSIFTNKPINLSLLRSFKPRIKEILYLIDDVKTHDPSFAKSCQELGVPFRILSLLPSEIINDIKLDYYDIGVINQKISVLPKDINELKTEKVENLFVKSNKLIIGREKMYNSRAAYRLDTPIHSIDDITPVVDAPDFWEDIQSFRILKKNII